MMTLAVANLAWAGVAFALSLAASAFARPKGKSNGIKPDTTPSTASTRGSHIPLIIGRRIVSPVVGWVGDRKARAQKQRSGKSLGGSETVTGYNYDEAAIHFLCLGPIDTIHDIRERGEPLLDAQIAEGTHPSGTAVTCNEGSVFRVYWGDSGNAVDPAVTRNLDFKSKYPGVCYIVWDRKKLGQSPFWPEITYDVSYYGALDTVDTNNEESINFGALLEEVLTRASPEGAGIDPTVFDTDTLDALKALSTSEVVGGNLVSDEETTVGSVFESVAREFGVAYSQEGEVLLCKSLRPATGDESVLDEYRIDGKPSRIVSRTDARPTHLSYTFSDINRRARTNAVDLHEDGRALTNGTARRQEESLQLITNADMATIVANRLFLDQVNEGSTASFRALRDAVLLRPGDITTIPGVGLARVNDVTLYGDGRSAQINAIASATLGTPEDQDVVTPSTSGTFDDPEEDLRVAVIDSSVLTSGSNSISVFRIRANDQVTTAEVFISADGGGYTSVGDQPHASGGDLTASYSVPTQQWAGTTAKSLTDEVRPLAGDSGGLVAVCTTAGTTGGTEPTWPTTAGATIADGTAVWTMTAKDGPVFLPLNGDYLDLPDNSSDTTAWTNGSMVAVLSDGTDYEVMYPQKLEAVDETAWAATTVYATGTARKPLTGSTGLRYVNNGSSGTSGSTEPSWPTVAGQTVVDGTVTWTAGYFRQTLKAVRRAREGSDWEALDTDFTAYAIERNDVRLLQDAKIAENVVVDVKPQPVANGRVLALSSITATQVTVGPPGP